MVTAAGAEGAAAVDKGRGPVGPSLSDLAIGSPVPLPPVQMYRAGHVRAGFVGLSIAPVNKQPAYLLNRMVNVNGTPRHSTERWYWSVTAPQQRTATQMHLTCRVAVTDECGLVAGEGGFFVGRFAYRLGSKHWYLDMAVGTGGGGGGWPALAPFLLSRWRHGKCRGGEFFSEAWQAMRGHVATFLASALGADVIDPDVVTDGEVTEGGRSDGGRSASGRSDGGRSARCGVGKGKKRQRDDLQAKLVDAERQRAATEARLEVLQRPKGWKPVEPGAGATPPSQSMVSVAPAATFSGQSMQFLASGLLGYSNLATRLMADARSSCQQLQTIAGLARTTTMPDLNVDHLPKVDAEVTTRLQNADRRYRSEVVAAAQQPGREPEPVVGSLGSSVPGTAALW